MAKIQVIKKGESLVFDFDIGDTPVDNYSCTITAKQYPEDEPSINRTVSIDSSGSWSGYLTSTETSKLAVGMWILNARIVNSVTNEQVDIPVRFQVSPSWTS